MSDNNNNKSEKNNEDNNEKPKRADIYSHPIFDFMNNIDADTNHPRNHNSPNDEHQENEVEKSAAAGEGDESASSTRSNVKNFPSDVAVDPICKTNPNKHDDDDMSGPQYVHSIDGNDTSANNHHPFNAYATAHLGTVGRDGGIVDANDDTEVPSRAPTEESSLITAEAPNFSNHTRTGHSRTSYGRNTLSSIGEDDLSFGTSNLISGEGSQYYSLSSTNQAYRPHFTHATNPYETLVRNVATVGVGGIDGSSPPIVVPGTITISVEEHHHLTTGFVSLDREAPSCASSTSGSTRERLVPYFMSSSSASSTPGSSSGSYYTSSSSSGGYGSSHSRRSIISVGSRSIMSGMPNPLFEQRVMAVAPAGGIVASSAAANKVAPHPPSSPSSNFHHGGGGYGGGGGDSHYDNDIEQSSIPHYKSDSVLEQEESKQSSSPIPHYYSDSVLEQEGSKRSPTPIPPYRPNAGVDDRSNFLLVDTFLGGASASASISMSTGSDDLLTPRHMRPIQRPTAVPKRVQQVPPQRGIGHPNQHTSDHQDLEDQPSIMVPLNIDIDQDQEEVASGPEGL